ncbi:MAG: DUF4440 domain-containing protein [Pseudomonadales bacterium]|nr:DUF4440 domain-containing protein [Pseudomonadales bacterium]
MTTTLEEILALEQEMHLTSTRRNRERMEQLLHPDFYEIGRSGVRYSRQEIMAEFENEGELPPIAVNEPELNPLNEDLVLLSYTSNHATEHAHRFTLRTSLWQRKGEMWQIRFHQGTPTAD